MFLASYTEISITSLKFLAIFLFYFCSLVSYSMYFFLQRFLMKKQVIKLLNTGNHHSSSIAYIILSLSIIWVASDALFIDLLNIYKDVYRFTSITKIFLLTPKFIIDNTSRSWKTMWSDVMGGIIPTSKNASPFCKSSELTLVPTMTPFSLTPSTINPPCCQKHSSLFVIYLVLSFFN